MKKSATKGTKGIWDLFLCLLWLILFRRSMPEIEVSGPEF